MSDPNDTARRGGANAVRSEFDNIVGFGAVKGIIFHGETSIVPPPMLVKGLLPFEGIAFIGGQSGAAKTFVAAYLATALATATPFFGKPVSEPIGVLIIAAEGRAMIGARIEAARRALSTPPAKLPVAWAVELPELKTGEQIKKYAAQLNCIGQRFRKDYGVRLGAIIIDTVASALDVDDEDDNSEAARIVRKMRELGRACSALIIPVHHYGKSTSTGLRGGSSWRAGADVILSVLADRDQETGDVKNRRLAIAKARDGIEGPVGPFTLQWVALDTDEDGAPFGTCVVEPVLGGQMTAKVAGKAKNSRAVRVFREAFTEALLKRGVERAVMGDGPWVRAVPIDDVRAEFRRRYATGEAEPDERSEAARKAFSRALDAVAAEFTTEIDPQGGAEWIWSK